jgi:hypothetical protein
MTDAVVIVSHGDDVAGIPTEYGIAAPMPVTGGTGGATSVTTTTGNLTALNQVVGPIQNIASVAVEVTGTFSGNVAFEVSNDGVTYFPVDLIQPGTLGAPGASGSPGYMYYGNVPGEYFRVRCNVYTSGTAVITIAGYVGTFPLHSVAATITGVSSGASSGLPGYSRLEDGVTAALASIAAFHNQDNQLTTTGNALLTGGVAQLLNWLGNLDRQRAAGIDGISAIGVATGSAQFAMQFRNSVAAAITANAVAQVVTPAAMSGTITGVAWSIQVGTLIAVDTGSNYEVVMVTAITATTFTAIFTKSHAANVLLVGFVYNQERDAAGELDGATGAGTAVAAGYEYNGGHPDGIHNYDRERNVQAKGYGSTGIYGGALPAGSTSFTAAGAGPTGLQPGSPIVIGGITGAGEVGYVAANYVIGSTTIPLQSPTIGGPYGQFSWDRYSYDGPALNGILPFGIGIEEDVVFNAPDGLYYIERSASSDIMPFANIPAVHSTLYNGASMDRARGVAFVGDAATGTGVQAIHGYMLNGAGTYDHQRDGGGWSAAKELSVETGTGAVTLANAATAVGALAGINLYTGRANHTLSTVITGAPTTVSVNLEGSIDGTHWYVLATSTSTTGDFQFATGKVFSQIRANVTALTGGAAPTVTCYYEGN